MTSREDIVLLARYAGLDLPAAYLDELVDAFGHVEQMVSRLPKSRPRRDEPAHVFSPLTFMPSKG